MLRAAPGLRFGSFDPISGRPFEPPRGMFTDYDYRADAYWGMIAAVRCRSIRVCGLELDGNQDALTLGGHWGDAGFQCAASGLYLYQNEHVEVDDVWTHHHGLDGVIIGHPGLTEDAPLRPHTLSRVRSEYNARQGLSWVGGIGLTATESVFSHTGKGRFASPPMAGVDVEAEDSVCRDGRFVRCIMENNGNQAVIADTGDSADVEFEGCRFWGTTGHALWVRKPRFRFRDCDVYGTTVNLYGHDDPDLATAFYDCRFEDRPYTSGQVHRGAAVIEIDAHNATFERCSVTGRGTRALWLDGEATTEILRDCVITHAFEGLPAGDFQSLIRGARLENVRFREELPAPSGRQWFIATGSLAVENVHVQGPRVRWGGPAGAVGRVP